jgi:tetratricopeptide (TPR) repeat protein
MNAKNLLILPLLFLLACTPKTTEKTPTPPPPPPPQQDESLSECPKWTDLPLSQADDVENNYVIYRDFLKVGDYTRAYELWQKVYAIAPAADGKRETVFNDGIYFYENLIRGEEDSIRRDEYIDMVFQLYDELDRCYPQGGYVSGRKAFDLYYKYPHKASPKEIFELFRASADMDGMKSQFFILNPFTALLVDQFLEGNVSVEEAKKYEELILGVLKKGLAECKGAEDCDKWNIINEYAPVRLEAFETVKGFYDCDYYLEKYYPDFQQNPMDCDVIRTVYSRLKWGECQESDPRFREVIQAGNKNCVEEKALASAYKALREARYREAIDLFQQAANDEKDAAKKANIVLTISKIYYSHLKNFPTARKFARDASAIRPNWGEPYMLIGRLYASSGPLCGPGRGWDSQVVTWPAIDMWNKARQVDPGVAREANDLINRYQVFMPSREDIFQKLHKEGETYFVGCWIQESTTIRAAPQY